MMAQKRMADFYDAFLDSVPWSKRMKLAAELVNLCEENMELFMEIPSFLHQKVSKRWGKRMNPVVLQALVANYPKLERFSRYKNGNDLIYNRKVGAFEAYKIISILSRRIRVALFMHLRQCDIFMNKYDYQTISCGKGDTVFFNAPFLEFIHFYMHFPFQAKDVRVICQCKAKKRVCIPNDAECLADILNDEKRAQIPACELLSLLINVESVKANSKCLMHVHRPLELKRLRFGDLCQLATLKVEGDVLNIVNNTGENLKFHVLFEKVKPNVAPKKINFNVDACSSRYPATGLIKPFRPMFNQLEEVNLVYCVSGADAEAAFAGLCKESRILAKTLKVNFRLRSVHNRERGMAEIKENIINVRKKFNSRLGEIDGENNCGYGFDLVEGNLNLHVCSGYNPKCALERNDGKKDAPVERQHIQKIMLQVRAAMRI